MPVIPTVRVVITFTKFMELRPTEYFYTPLSSPTQFATTAIGNEDEGASVDKPSSGGSHRHHQYGGRGGGHQAETEDPFVIPSGYVWSSSEEKCRKMKRSNSMRRTK